MQAIENIRKAKNGPPSERTANLRESLRLFTKASSHLSSSKLSEVVQEFNSLSFQPGSLDLSLSCASSWDPDSRGLSFWRDRQPRGDSRSSSWEARNFCYTKALETLQSADDALDEAVKKGMFAGDAETLRNNTRQKALSSADEAWLYRLYDWHLEKGLIDQLLDIQSPTLEYYLLQEPATLERFDLLWQYYSRHYQNMKAAQILASLADSPDFELSLEKRLEYLSLASSNAKAQFPSRGAAEGEDVLGFLNQIEEKLEVGAVQVEVWESVNALVDLEEKQKKELLEKLQRQLLGVSEVRRQPLRRKGL